METILSVGCTFKVYKLKRTGKNALDFYIAAECGYISHTDTAEIAIISNDKGFGALIDFFDLKTEAQNIQIVKASNIEKAFMGFSSPLNSQRKELISQNLVYWI